MHSFPTKGSVHGYGANKQLGLGVLMYSKHEYISSPMQNNKYTLPLALGAYSILKKSRGLHIVGVLKSHCPL